MTSGMKFLVERSDQLKQMNDASSLTRNAGQLVFVEGEAGHGKTSLIEAFRSGLDHRYTKLTGACDPVAIPTPFAPFYEMLGSLPETLASEILRGEDRQRIYASLLDLMEADPTALIIEDLHWADEVTLGLVRYIGKRLERTGSLVVLSYRPEEIDTTHPLLVILADLAATATTVQVPPLTVEGVKEMASGSDADPELIHAATLGNPFFVDEILANPDQDLPATIGAAVMASVAKLPTGAHDLLEMVALSPEGLDLAIAEGNSPEATHNIDSAIQRRLLILDRDKLRCRHDLIRITVDTSVPPARRRRIHLRLLEALESGEHGRGAVARLAHHSVEAGVADKAIEYSLRAAAIARADGANRQARHHYEAALRFRDAMDDATLDAALLEAANVHCATNFLPEAAEASYERIVFASDEFDLGVRHASAAFFAVRWGDASAATKHADRAFEILSRYEPSQALAETLDVMAVLAAWEARWSDAAELARDALDLATKLGASAVQAHARLLLGRTEFSLDVTDWETPIQQAIKRAIDSGTMETACSGMNALAAPTLWSMDLDLALERFDAGIEFSAAHEMDAWYVAMTATRASCYLSQGRWIDAGQALERALGWPTCAATNCEAQTLLATLKARMGDPGAAAAVEAALASTDQIGAHWERVLACLLSLEAAWLGLMDRELAMSRYATLVERDHVDSDPYAQKRLQFWMSMLEPASQEHFADESRYWADRNFTFEALLLESMTAEPPLDEIFAWLQEREADGVMRALRAQLRDRGLRQIPRGVRASTANNVAGLTRRQADVLTLLAKGHTNSKIAEELFISAKTVGHHVSAILDKLEVENRGQAAAVATERGLI